MSEKRPQREVTGSSRRGFLGGVGALVAAAAYTRDIPTAVAARVANDKDGDVQRVTSPDGSISVTIDVADGVPSYEVACNGTTYIAPSTLGFDFQNQPPFGAGEGGDGAALVVTGSEHESATEEWVPVWGATNSVSAEYNTLSVGLEETDGPGRGVNLEFRVFDDGVGFRFVLDEGFSSNSERAVVTSENTGFDFADDYIAWWIRNEVTNPRFEQEYTESPLSEIPGGTRETRPTDTQIRNGTHTPLTVDAEDVYLSVHESNLADYAAATLAPRSEEGGTEFTTELTPLPDGTKASLELPAATPWRTIQVGNSPGDLVESELIPLLADPLEESAFPTVGDEPDTDWITPRKYVGIWWTMIAGSANWEYRPDESFESPQEAAGYIHGARTERMKRYMAFAGENGIDSVLVEGWNEGWDTYPGDGSGLDFSVDGSYSDFDVREVTEFGRELDDEVEMTIHNETAGNLPQYETQIAEDDIFAQYEDEGIHSIKNGYVSDPGLIITDEDENPQPTHNQHNQLAVNHHRLVMQEAAADRQMLEIHEGIRPTGEIRTYPNVANREVVKAQEYDGFDYLNSDVGRDHHVTLPFTRMLAGPTSYQPGIFDLTFNDDRGGQIQTTRAKQLAMYPNYLSGLQMAADRMEAYVDSGFEVGEALQAASGDLDGIITLDEWRNAFGTNAVAVDPNRVPSGSSVSFTVRDVESAGTYDLHLRYASAPEDNAERVIEAGGPRATLRVNDSVETIEPGFTDYWDEWEVFTTEIDLEEGGNEIAIELDYENGDTFEGDVGGFNLNTIAITEAGDPSPIPAEYEGYTPEDENFDAKPEFSFIEDVPAAGWDETRVVDSAIGDYIVTARRKGEEWYVGAMTDEGGRAIDVPLDFLAPGKSGGGRGQGPSGPKYVAEIYSDGVGAGVDADQTSVRIDEAIVDPSSTVLASMAPSGGTAIRLRRAKGRERSELPSYKRPEQEITYSVTSEAGLDEAFITATGSNDGEFIGGTPVEIEVDGEVVAVDNVRLPPGASDETVELGYRIGSIGTYNVVVRDFESGAEVASGTVSVEPGELIAEFEDPSGDDHGPGGYVYPTDGAFEEGAFDLRSVGVYEIETEYRFAFEVENLYDTFGGEFSPHYFLVYLRDSSSLGGRTTELGDLGLTAEFAEEWHYRIDANGFGRGIVDSEGTDLGTPGLGVDFTSNTVIVSVEKDTLGDLDVADMEIAPLVGSEDNGTLRPVEVEAGPFVFGGAREGAVGNAPRVVDLLIPEKVEQEAALAYDAESFATIPFTSL
ncbi:glycoside hydrolase family 97 catalytic domain-containing protein [Halalkalicoccus subterraneus]|uniref:glycoside hydrolase family 97 catalytic domain-containing protein n=1 Tax=Halalkalicoccus subterraneus TaxID=2675002 RepID=UPI000EFD3092|nr:glycoside hydrolase family 97 catalytic domain-containing protein [Halalkalicoccus subterraneus]